MRAPGFTRPARIPRRSASSRGRAADREPVRAPTCCALLGPQHPLSRAVETLHRITDQALAVTAVLVGSLVGLAGGTGWALWMAVAAVVVLAVLALRAAMVEQQERLAALALIAAGHDTLPVEAVQRQRRKLVAERRRSALAGTVADLLKEASHPRPPVRGVRPLYDPRVVRAVSTELEHLIDQLEDDRAPAATLARTQLLIIDGTSALYGHEPEPLRDELRRIAGYPAA
jgi:hypothetical protein